MKYRQLGKTDLNVSRICFGCWQLTPRTWGEVPVQPWEQAVRKALDLGVNFIDTADAYGNGHAETCLGNFLKREGLRNEFVIATKFYWNFEDDPWHPDTRYDYILRECDASLKRLQTDRIDLYQIHSFDALTRPEEVAAALHQLKRQGKARWFGVSNLNPEQMRMYGRYFRIDSLQPPYSLLNRGAEKEEFPYCLANDIGAMVYSPLYRGLLTGKYARDHVFEDTRRDNPLFTGKAFERMLDALDELRPYADNYGLTVAQLAVRWVLTHPAVTAAIVGIKTQKHIETIVDAVDGELSGADWFHTARLIEAAKAEATA